MLKLTNAAHLQLEETVFTEAKPILGGRREKKKLCHRHILRSMFVETKEIQGESWKKEEMNELTGIVEWFSKRQKQQPANRDERRKITELSKCKIMFRQLATILVQLHRNHTKKKWNEYLYCENIQKYPTKTGHHRSIDITLVDFFAALCKWLIFCHRIHNSAHIECNN